MWKRLLLIFILVMVCLSMVVVFLAGKVPSLLVSTLEKELGKKVALEGLRYRFPLTFEVKKLAVYETGEFGGELSLSVENLMFRLSGDALWMRKLELSELDIRSPQIIVRKQRQQFIHALSRQPSGSKPATPATTAEARPESSSGREVAFETIRVHDGLIKFIDYDIDAQGFVIQFQRVDAEVEGLRIPFQKSNMPFDIKAEIAQGRNTAPATLTAKGEWRGSEERLDADVQLQGLSLPYFYAYSRRVTPAHIDRGELKVTSKTVVQHKQGTTHATLFIKDLAFADYEMGNQLFGFDATSLINILKDRSGSLEFPVILKWDRRDPNASIRSVVRQGIQESLQATFLLNLQNIVGNTLEQVAERGTDQLDQDIGKLLEDVQKLIH